MIDKKLMRMYWLIPLVLALAQAIYTMHSFNQIRLEELDESVRSVYWFKKHLVYHPISTSVGWYAALHIIYSIFGFSLFTAKIYRLFLQTVALFCLADILQRYIGKKFGIIPLITFGLSPTFLYFNTLSLNLGIDIQYFLICIWLIVTLPEKDDFFLSLRLSLIGFLLMGAWLTYPGFLLLLTPSLIVLGWKMLKSETKSLYVKVKKIMFFLVGFLTPLVSIYFSISNTEFLFTDSTTKVGGLFRGNGTIDLGIRPFINNLNILSSDFFSKSISYYFELAKVEFSDIYPIVTLALLLGFSLFITIKIKKCRTILILFWIVFLLNFILSIIMSGSSNFGGIRRSTAMLLLLYAFFAISWKQLFSLSKISLKRRLVLASIFLLIPLHHVIVYPINFHHITDQSVFSDKLWFIPPSPSKSLHTMVEQLKKKDLQIACQDSTGQVAYCRYDRVYAALAASCEYNRLSCHTIQGWDPRTNAFVVLDPHIWKSGYLHE